MKKLRTALAYVIVLLVFQLNASAQAKRQSVEVSALTIIKRATQELPLAFAWQLNSDTLLKANDVFKEMIEFAGNAVMRRFMAEDTVSLKKHDEKGYDVRRSFVSFTGETADYEISEQQDKNLLILEHTQTQKKLHFKVTRDKSRKKILRMECVESGRVYWPVDFEGGSVSG